MTFTSTAGNIQWLVLNVSLTKRLILFRVTAQPTFLLTVTPSRAWESVLACHTTRIPREANFCAASFSPRNSDLFRNRKDGGKEFSAGADPPAKKLFCSNADRQIFSAFSSSALDNQTPVFCGHSHQKTVSPFSRNVAWLKCSFHVPYLWNLFFRKRVFTHVTPLLSRYLLWINLFCRIDLPWKKLSPLVTFSAWNISTISRIWLQHVGMLENKVINSCWKQCW